ncbi:hypothetical protein [Paraburkholderia aromaticivorans]|uniref:hypothetical protein n=1 Tax=Paraburkholderia aromaticivorans TaxID=2026199 RepID=UPI0038B7CA44
MKSITAFERRSRSSVAPWCCAVLLVAALAVIVIDLIVAFRGTYADTDVVDQNVLIKGALSRTAGFELSKGSLRSASGPGLGIPDSGDFGIRKALNAELLKGRANPSVLDGWLLTEPEIGSGDSD